jgi:hypothetical protein
MTRITMAWLFLAAVASAQESAKPIEPVDKTVREYKIIRFAQQRVPDWRFVITYVDDQGGEYADEHYGPVYTTDPSNPSGPPIKNPNGADELLKTFNTMNFSTNSMVKRLLQHLQDHGKIPPSTIAGTPDAPTAVVTSPAPAKPTPAKPPIKKS